MRSKCGCLCQSQLDFYSQKLCYETKQTLLIFPLFLMSFFTRFQKKSFVAWLLGTIAVVAVWGFVPVDAFAGAESAAVARPFFIVRAEPGTQIYRLAGTDKIPVGVVGKDGVFDSVNVPAGMHVFVFEHEDAQAPCRIENVNLRGGEITKLAPELKMRTGELMVSCLPGDVALFVNGELKGHGALMMGGLPIGQEITVEARSSRYGVQTRRVKLRPGEMTKLSFDLRGNIPAQKPDGKIVLPEVPLVLAIQQGAVVKVDGAPVTLIDDALMELPLGPRVVEISLPLKGRMVTVWRGTFAARSAIMPGADVPAVATDAPEDVKPVADDKKPDEKAVIPAEPEKKITGKVGMLLSNTRFHISISDTQGLKSGSKCRLVVALDVDPLLVRLATVTGSGALAILEKSPEGYVLKEGTTFVLEPTE